MEIFWYGILPQLVSYGIAIGIAPFLEILRTWVRKRKGFSHNHSTAVALVLHVSLGYFAILILIVVIIGRPETSTWLLGVTQLSFVGFGYLIVYTIHRVNYIIAKWFKLEMDYDEYISPGW